MSGKYELLLSPGTIGSVELRNKTVMCAMGMNMSNDGFVNDAVINHYAERSKGGIGLIMVEVTCVDTPLGRNTANMLVIDDDKYIPGMTKLTSAIHQGGAKCFLQISHTGRGARRSVTGAKPVGPSPVAMPYSFMMGLDNEEPRELTIAEIKTIEDKYAEAALRAKKAGFDGVEIHSVGYYLGQQFLSSKANIRNDEYGGNPENRCLFHRNIIAKVKEKCGKDFPVAVKLSAIELGEDAGITMEEGIYYAKRFQDSGADAIEVLAGTWKKDSSPEDIPDTGSGKGQALGLCMALKMGIQGMTGAPATIKMIGGGRSQDPEVGEKALQDNLCEFIFIGKGVLVQPDLMNLVAEGRQDEIRPCIGCGVCINEQLQGGKPARCSGNAVIGYKENDYRLTKTNAPKKIFVVGGGIAGVEAARIAAKRGHKVTLIEASDRIGGQLFYAAAPLNKCNLAALIPYLERQLEVTGVEVRLGHKISAQEVIEESPDIVICATGVKPAKLPIPGYEKALRAKDVLDFDETGDSVAIIGGGVVGCELAELLAKKGKKVAIIEMLDDVALKMVAVPRTILLGHLKNLGVQLLTSCKCKEIFDGGVVYQEANGVEKTLEVDSVVEAVGDRPETELYDALKGKIPNLHIIGDAKQPDNIVNAVADGYHLAAEI